MFSTMSAGTAGGIVFCFLRSLLGSSWTQGMANVTALVVWARTVGAGGTERAPQRVGEGELRGGRSTCAQPPPGSLLLYAFPELLSFMIYLPGDGLVPPCLPTLIGWLAHAGWACPPEPAPASSCPWTPPPSPLGTGLLHALGHLHFPSLHQAPTISHAKT